MEKSKKSNIKHYKFPEVLSAGRHIVKSVKAKADQKRKFSEKTADLITKYSGSLTFLILNTVWFVVWIVINLDMIPGIKAFDPFPFGLLTMIVSLEAIILAVFVLISQNRQNKVDDLREEVDLEVDIITEKEVTKILKVLRIFLEKNGYDLSGDQELQSMIKTTNMKKIEDALEKEMDEN